MASAASATQHLVGATGRLSLAELGRLARGDTVCGRSPGGDPLRPIDGMNSGIASANTRNSKANVEEYRRDAGFSDAGFSVTGAPERATRQVGGQGV
jgi:hypothetical protein